MGNSHSKCAQADEAETLVLDPHLWRELPQDSLIQVMKKLPFATVAAFRALSKKWHSDIIPRKVAPHAEQAPRAWTLLYFNVSENGHGEDGFPRWTQIFNAKNELTLCSFHEFKESSFFCKASDEDVRLVHCEEGLLFFGLMRRRDESLRSILVHNPLTDQSKELVLPQRLRPVHCNVINLLIGVAFDSDKGSYDVVVVGRGSDRKSITYLYSSLTSVWTLGLPLCPTLLEEVEGGPVAQLRSGPIARRSVFCNDNICWYMSGLLRSRERQPYVLIYNLQPETWKLVPEGDMIMCEENSGGQLQITSSHHREVLFWHMHRVALSDENDEFSYHDVFAFSQCDIIYHTVRIRQAMNHLHQWLHIVVQNTRDSSYTELPLVPLQSLGAFHSSAPWNVWSFSPSLTSMP